MKAALFIDLSKCIGCDNCVVACKDEFVENDWPPYSKSQAVRHFWMKLNLVERGQLPKMKVQHVPVLCMNCEDAPCEKAATGGAVYRRPDGIVIIDPEKSKGQKQIVASCPYGAIYWNDQLDIPQMCTRCAHLLDRGWKEPRCVQACPIEALKFGNYDDLKATIEQSGAAPMNPEFGTKPMVFYKDLPKTFIAGALVDASTGDSIDGGDVTLSGPEGTMQTKSDGFGDFWFDDLDANKSYQVSINAAGKTKTISVTLDTDKDLGDIML
jgi:tetrathionate reductase subunit B